MSDIADKFGRFTLSTDSLTTPPLTFTFCDYGVKLMTVTANSIEEIDDYFEAFKDIRRKYAP